MAKPKALLLGQIDFAHETWQSLSNVAELVTPTAKTRQEFIEECKQGKLDGVVACYRTNSNTSVAGIWDQELIDALPKSLRFCCHNGAGYDQISVSVCSARDPPIYVSNTPGAVNDATADTAIFLLIGALRNFNASMFALRNKTWRGKPAPAFGHDPQGKVLGILGMGGIGRNMKRKCDAFGMKTIYHNRSRLSEEEAAGAEYVGFEELLQQSDVLSLNLPLNDKTRHIISRAQFAQMKPGIVIVNTARGAVMDEAALVEALESGQVRSCGLDVFEDEPEIHPGLLANENVMLLPHMGTWCVETQTKMEELVIENVRLGIVEGRLKTGVPEQKGM